MSKEQRTLVLIKPDAMQRGLAGQTIARLEARGLKIVAMKLVKMSTELAKRHYAVHEGKPFFPGLVQFITSSPIIAIVFQGREAIDVVRNTMGATDSAKAGPGTIRGDWALDVGRNLVHGSDSPENAKKEIGIFFSSKELLDYPREMDKWITEP